MNEMDIQSSVLPKSRQLDSVRFVGGICTSRVETVAGTVLCTGHTVVGTGDQEIRSGFGSSQPEGTKIRRTSGVLDCSVGGIRRSGRRVMRDAFGVCSTQVMNP